MKITALKLYADWEEKRILKNEISWRYTCGKTF